MITTPQNLSVFYREIGNTTSLVNQPVFTKIGDISNGKPSELQYVPNFCKPGIHLGQRKLFLSELQYLTNVWPHLIDNKINYVVYAGAAPATHTHFLAKFFPNVKFILVDLFKLAITII